MATFLHKLEERKRHQNMMENTEQELNPVQTKSATSTLLPAPENLDSHRCTIH